MIIACIISFIVGAMMMMCAIAMVAIQKDKKPRNKVRFFVGKTEMHKHPDFGWVKSIHYGTFSCINGFSNYGNTSRVSISNMSMVMEYAFDNYTFADGTPFGIKEE